MKVTKVTTCHEIKLSELSMPLSGEDGVTRKELNSLPLTSRSPAIPYQNNKMLVCGDSDDSGHEPLCV